MEPHCTHLFMEVGDFEKAKSFWTEVIGLRVIDDRSPHYVAVGGNGGFAIGIEPAPGGEVVADGPEITVRVDDLDAAAQRLRELGVSIVGGPADQAWGARHVWLLDPDGRRMSIYSAAATIMDAAGGVDRPGTMP